MKVSSPVLEGEEWHLRGVGGGGENSQHADCGGIERSAVDERGDLSIHWQPRGRWGMTDWEGGVAEWRMGG